MKRLLLLVVAVTMMAATSASDPSERLPNPAQEARARHLFKQLRCVQCQNESIDDSAAPIAADLRRDVREQIVAGQSDQQILDWMNAHYTEYILLKPPFSVGNLALWLGPFAVLALGGGAMALALRRKDAPQAELDPAEDEALHALLERED